MRRSLLVFVSLGLVFNARLDAASQQTEEDKARITEEISALRKELDALKASYETRLSALESRLAALEEKAPAEEASLASDLEEELARLEEQQARDRALLQEEIEKTRRAFAPIAFTPQITMFANAMGRADNKTVISPEGDPIDDRFVLRAGEFELRAAIDPFADGFLAIPLEAESPEGPLQADVEEGFVLLKRLPLIAESPWGLKLKIGKYRPEIGKNNLIHFHDLMWTTRPLPVATFLGTEGLGESAEAGFQAVGVNADFFVPSPSTETTLRMQLGFGSAGNLRLTEANEGENLVFYVHPSWYQRLTDSDAFELGGSYLRGANDPLGTLTSALGGVDFTYTWKPARRGLWRSFVAGGEFFYASLEQADLPSLTPLGYYFFGQYQPTRNFYVGLRHDFTEELADEDVETRVWAGYLTYYTSEFLRFRFGAEHRISDFSEKDSLNTFFAEVNFVFGAHPPEPYWVHR